MKDNSQIYVAIKVTVMVDVWVGPHNEYDVNGKPDGSDMISLRRVMPVDGSLDAMDKVGFHLPLMAAKCSEALASRLSL